MIVHRLGLRGEVLHVCFGRYASGVFFIQQCHSKARTTLPGQCLSTLMISCFSSKVGALAGYPCGEMTTAGRFSVGSADASSQVFHSLPVSGFILPSLIPPTVRESYLKGGVVSSRSWKFVSQNLEVMRSASPRSSLVKPGAVAVAGREFLLGAGFRGDDPNWHAHFPFRPS